MKTLSHPMKLTIAALLVAVAGTVASMAQAQPMMGGMGGMGGPGHHGPMMGGDGPRGPGMHLGERMLDRVKATPEQRTQIRQIMDVARKDMQAQHEAGRALRDQQMQLFTQPNVDANAAETLRQKQLAMHDQASKRMTQAMVEASRVLTPEQRTQLANDFKQRREMRERHMRERSKLDAAPK